MITDRRFDSGRSVLSGPWGPSVRAGGVGINDLLILLSGWGECPTPPAQCPADLDLDGTVGITDLLILLANWG